MRPIRYTKREWNSARRLFDYCEPVDAVFHAFGSAYEECETGFGNYSTAIIELQDGTVLEVLPTDIKFKMPPAS